MARIDTRRYSTGITLIELMIVLLVLSILTGLAYPSYSEFVRKSRRADATVALNDLASRMERYYTENNTYATATIATAAATDVLTSAASPENYYTVSIESATASAYSIKATRVSTEAQAGDTACADFTYTSTGVKGVTGTAAADKCW